MENVEAGAGYPTTGSSSAALSVAPQLPKEADMVHAAGDFSSEVPLVMEIPLDDEGAATAHSDACGSAANAEPPASTVISVDATVLGSTADAGECGEEATNMPAENGFDKEEEDAEDENENEDENEDEDEEVEDEEVYREEAEEEDKYDPDEDAVASSASPSPGVAPPLMITLGNRQYKPSVFVKNRGLSYVPGKLKSNPKASFETCTVAAPHSILDCQKLHFSNRGVLVRDRYIRLNMLVDNPGKEKLLRDPVRSLHMHICRRDLPPQNDASHDPSTCHNLHLRPNIVFVGVPGLRTAYFTAELRQNLGFTNLQNEPWDTQCGTWCRTTRSHVVTTCCYLHFHRGDNHTEKPNPPHRPLAAIPDLTPSRPAQAADVGRRRGRGRGRGGRGGRGGSPGRGRGRGSFRGRGRGDAVRRGGGSSSALPRAFHPEYLASPDQDTTYPRSCAAVDGGTIPPSSSYSDDASTKHWMSNAPRNDSTLDRFMLRVIVVLLGIFGVLLAVALHRKFGTLVDTS